MSLLMDYLPEWYSSNVNQPKKSAKQKQQQLEPNKEMINPSKIFYVLKDDQFNLDDFTTRQQPLVETPQLSSLLMSHTPAQEVDLIKQNRIRNDLLNMLTQQPNKFAAFNLPDTFNCSNKQKGFHRDPFDCTKYYFCSDQQPSVSSPNTFLFNKATITGANRIESNVIQIKAYTCPKNTMFNMNGCYCEKETSSNLNCHYLSDTYCDFALFRNVDKKFT